jgi:NAD(P)-dependent dehydrogenase (short-subunit alcohol dehydrogenase family)
MDRAVSAAEGGPLAGRVALVTGSSRGIGRATAEALAAAGATVAVHHRGSAAAAEELAGKLAGSGVAARAYGADFNVAGAVEELVAAVTADFGGIDILVNNAAMLRVATTESTTEELWDEIIRVDLTSPFRCVQQVLPSMRERGGGAIVNVASIAGVVGGAMGPGYAAAKGGLISLTKYLSRLHQVRGAGQLRRPHLDRYRPAGHAGGGRADRAHPARQPDGALRRPRRGRAGHPLPGLR